MTDDAQSVLEQISGRGAQTWKLTIAYDGTDFSGWQIQPGEPTIQGELQAALGRIVGESPLPQGSGRTDAGVHALAQVASFPLQARIPPANLLRALNRTLPGSIRILEAQIVAETFHARHSAVAKTYEYRVLPIEPAEQQLCSPFLARYVYPYSWRLDPGVLNAAAAAFLGEHDFRSFAATDPDLATRTDDRSEDSAIQIQTRGPQRQVLVAGLEARTAIRTIYSSAWREETTDGFHLFVYRVRGNGFLHHMVRNLVGTMLDIARGYMRIEDIPVILAANDRSKAGPTAPARGLYLHSVEYDGAETISRVR
ncbi:tRNA pseudouridine synthase A [Telmatobacter sp. DSM 110680]|uniref:tRNA pseudouridine synthase A n=1 Tax=Telmatobacter sp. DSM 110680 TaxID=3036704 RepID=A0AAU7DFV0_9BACT